MATGRVDVLLVQSGGSPFRPDGRLCLLLNRGRFQFEEHEIDIAGAGFTADHLGLETQIANVADFNKDGFLDILLTRSRGSYDHQSIGNSLLASDGAFDRFHDLGQKMGIASAQATIAPLRLAISTATTGSILRSGRTTSATRAV